MRSKTIYYLNFQIQQQKIKLEFPAH
uniref:Uncharacterized protein n=1 Tax=Rhizophora mucronata TaxID=61149 RepID=A0A2P2PVN5_RHIMU